MKSIRLVLAMALGAMLCACSFLKSEPVTAQLVVRAVTAQAIESADNPQHLARRIVEIGGNALVIVQVDAQATVDMIADAVIAKIQYQTLTPADRDAVDLLLIAIETELRERVGDGVIDPDERLLVRDVITWVIQSAARYTEPAQG